MNMRDCQILHLDTSKSKRKRTFIAILHFTVTVESSVMSTTNTLK